MQRLAQYAHWAVFLILELLAGIMLFRYNHYQQSVWLTQANAVVGRVLEWKAGMLSYVGLGKRNAELTERNIVLQMEATRLRRELGAAQPDSTDTDSLRAEALNGARLIPAQVVANSVRRDDNYLTINRGSADGVCPEMGVLSGTGIVGIVGKTSPHYALVMSVLNTQSSISCRLRGTEYFGYLHWQGGSPLRAYIDDIPRHARFEVGDEVETSGYSSVFPAGIFVGRVAKISDSADGLAYRLEVELSTDLANVRDVCIIVRDDAEELDSMIVEN